MDPSSCKLYLRFKQQFITYHSIIYDKPFKCRSCIISFNVDDDTLTNYGNILFFVQHHSNIYALVQEYEPGRKSIIDFVDIPNALHAKAKQLYPLLQLTDQFRLISVEKIKHKCVSIPVEDLFCLSEIRVDYEHE